MTAGAGLLARERATLERYLPGLDQALRKQPLDALEGQAAAGVAAFRACGGPALLVPTEFRGLGASLEDGIRAQRAIGARSPSLAVATTMHHFSIATLADMLHDEHSFEWLVLEAVARNNLLVASGIAEGRGGVDVATPTLRAHWDGDDLVVNGSKKPCSLSRSMDLLTASVALPGGAEPEWAIAVVAADSPGLERRSFWRSPILAGAESDEVVLRDVRVPRRLVSRVDRVGKLSESLESSFIWFELLIAASYLGAATRLVEEALERGAGGELADAAIELEGAMGALAAVATEPDDRSDRKPRVARAVLARFHAQAAIGRAARLALECCGGRGFVESFDAAYFFAAAHALAFHPPRRRGIADQIVEQLRGTPLDLGREALRGPVPETPTCDR